MSGALTRIGLVGPMGAYRVFLPKAEVVLPPIPYPDWMLEHFIMGDWVDLGDDVLNSLACEYGIRSNDPGDRVATTGEMSYALDNSASNSARTLGYYSPLNPSKRPGFDFTIPVRWRLAFGSAAAYKFRGRLSDINVTPGVDDTRDVSCKVLDWMDDAARIDLPDIEAQLDKREDELVTLILDGLQPDDQPPARSIETGLETFDIALDGAASDSTRPKVRDELINIARSSYGYGYPRGDSVQGGTFQWENRHHRAINTDVLFTLTDDMIQGRGLAVPGSRDEIYNTIQVFLRPTRVDSAPTTVLFSLQTVQTLVQPGEVNDTLFGPYRDPISNDQIGGTAQVTPEATTDYTMNSASDGSGADLTANFMVSASVTGLGVRFTIVNNGATSGYVTKLQIRGEGIYRYDAMIEVAIPNSYGTRTLALEMIYQGNTNIATDIATYLKRILSVPLAHIKTVMFLANDSVAMMQAAILREPGDRIAVSETVTAIGDEYTINGVRLELQPGNLLYCTWWLDLANTLRFFRWGISAWGVDTVYGF